MQEPGGDADHEHGRDDRRIPHVTEYVHLRWAVAVVLVNRPIAVAIAIAIAFVAPIACRVVGRQWGQHSLMIVLVLVIVQR